MCVYIYIYIYIYMYMYVIHMYAGILEAFIDWASDCVCEENEFGTGCGCGPRMARTFADSAQGFGSGFRI